MNKPSNKLSTGTTSQMPSKIWYLEFTEWLSTWWPAVFLFIALIGAGISKYLFPNEIAFELMIQIIKSIGVIMAVFYVIYTRTLALETKKMAIASMGMYDSEKGTVLVELGEGDCSFGDLCEDAKKLTRDVHIKEKKLSESEFKDIMTQSSLPAIYLRIKNRSARRIDLSKIEYSARHTGSDVIYNIICNISKVGNIGPWEDKEVYLILSPEGEVEISLSSLDYLDGGIVQRKSNIDNKWKLERIRNPVKVTNG